MSYPLRTISGMDLPAFTANEWTAIASWVTAVVAAVGLAFAGRQVLELRKTREEQARPLVYVDVQPSQAWGNFLNLVVENVGSTLARDVTIEFDKALESSQSSVDFADTVLLREGIATLPPGRGVHTFFDASHKRIESELPMRYEATVRCKDARGRAQVPLRYVIDLKYLYGRTEINEYGVHHVAKALQEIEKSVKKW